MHFHFDPSDPSSLFTPCLNPRCVTYGTRTVLNSKNYKSNIPEDFDENGVPGRDTNTEDCSDDFGRTLIESGDYGYSGNGDYPHVHDPLWRAINGHSKADHLKHIAPSEEWERQHLLKGHSKKIILAGRKRGKVMRLERRKYRITSVSLMDPDILPRNMSVEDFVEIYSGVTYANLRYGTIFNMHVTFNWRDLGYNCVPGEEAPLYDEFIRHFTDWCKKRDISCVWIYSNESSSKVGLHSHFLTSIPKDKQREFERWLQKRKVKINRRKVFDRSACYLADETAWNTDVQWLRVQYLCKGVDPNALLNHADRERSIRAADLIVFNYESPGEVVCKRRCGLSGNIRESERRKFPFLSDLELGYLNVDSLYSDKEYRIWYRELGSNGWKGSEVRPTESRPSNSSISRKVGYGSAIAYHLRCSKPQKKQNCGFALLNKYKALWRLLQYSGATTRDISARGCPNSIGYERQRRH